MRHERILWGAIAFSTVIYAIVAWSMAPSPEKPFETSLHDTTTLVLYAAALMMFVTAMLVPGMLRSADARLRMIVGLGMFEGCAIFGLIAAMLHHDWRLYLPAWALALIGFLRVWPSAEVSAPVP
jgi:uncharacterized membrane protein